MGSIQVTAAPNAQREESIKAGSIILKSGDSPVQFPNTIFFANNDLLSNHKPLLKKVLAVIAAATEWIRTNRDAAVAVCAKTVGRNRGGLHKLDQTQLRQIGQQQIYLVVHLRSQRRGHQIRTLGDGERRPRHKGCYPRRYCRHIDRRNDALKANRNGDPRQELMTHITAYKA